MTKWIFLAAGGCAGTFARYFVSGLAYQVFGTNFPYGTLTVNILGCFFIGLLTVLAEEKFVLSPEARLLLMVGFFGAFTTFSTFMLETGNLIRSGESWRAFVNVASSLIIGFLVFRLGILVGELA